MNAASKQVAFFDTATSFKDFFASNCDVEPWLLRTAARDLVSGRALEKDTPIPWIKKHRAMTTVAAFRNSVSGVCVPYRLMGQPYPRSQEVSRMPMRLACCRMKREYAVVVRPASRIRRNQERRPYVYKLPLDKISKPCILWAILKALRNFPLRDSRIECGP